MSSTQAFEAFYVSGSSTGRGRIMFGSSSGQVASLLLGSVDPVLVESVGGVPSGCTFSLKLLLIPYCLMHQIIQIL